MTAELVPPKTWAKMVSQEHQLARQREAIRGLLSNFYDREQNDEVIAAVEFAERVLQESKSR